MAWVHTAQDTDHTAILPAPDATGAFLAALACVRRASEPSQPSVSGLHKSRSIDVVTRDDYRARYSGGLFAAAELPGVAPPLVRVGLVTHGGLLDT
jgi:hypothetical protein